MKRITVAFLMAVLFSICSVSAGNVWHDVTATVYNPTVEQCNSDPLTTSSGRKIDLDKLKRGKLRWCAVSRDLLQHFPYGSYIYVWIEKGHPYNGVWRVTDCMNKRFSKRIDFLTYDAKYGKWEAKIQKNV